MPSPVHLWIPVRAGVFFAHQHIVHHGLCHLDTMYTIASELSPIEIEMIMMMQLTKAMASGLVEGSTSIEIGAGTPSMAAGTYEK